jgi:hypothetical protein
MRPIAQYSHHLLFSLIASVSLVGVGSPSTAHAGTWTGLSGAGIQCRSTSVDDSGTVVGTCEPSNQGSSPIAWVALQGGSSTPLPVPANYQYCKDPGIANDGAITLNCVSKTGNNVGFALYPDATGAYSSETKLSPYGDLLSTDTSSFITARNKHGDAIAQSSSASGDASHSAVLYLSSSNGSPILVSSSHGDNCSPASLTTTYVNNLGPAVAENCPNSANTADEAYVALPLAGLLGVSYSRTKLSVPSNAVYCKVYAINDADAAIGDCFYSTAPLVRAAYWSSPSSAPEVLNDESYLSSIGIPATNITSSTFLNNGGEVIVAYPDAQGRGNYLYWNPAKGTAALIAPVTGGRRVTITGLSDNGYAVGYSETPSCETKVAIKWSPSGGTVSLGDYAGGNVSEATDISPSGTYIAGDAQDSSENEDALTLSNH